MVRCSVYPTHKNCPDFQSGAADDLELVGWLCERIWVLQGNFTHDDGYAAARVSIAEMLKTGTTCFLESMVIVINSAFENTILNTNSLPIDMVSMGFVEQ